MTAPINTGDIHIGQKPDPPGVDPEYGYPGTVLAMTPRPMAMFRLNEDSPVSNTVAVDETGESANPGNNIYQSSVSSTKGNILCDGSNKGYFGCCGRRGCSNTKSAKVFNGNSKRWMGR